MGLKYHPPQGSVVTVDFSFGFKEPEMVQKRLAIVLSPAIKSRVGLLTVVPLSTTAPAIIMPYHCQIDLPFALPNFWGNRIRWLKGDMVNAVGFHRVDLLILGKDAVGKRVHQTEQVPDHMFRMIQECVRCGLGL